MKWYLPVELPLVGDISSRRDQGDTLFDIDLSSCCASIQPMSQQRSDVVGMFLCMLCCFIAFAAYTRSFCEFIGKPQLWIFIKLNFWLWEWVQLQLTIMKTTYLMKKVAFEFSRYSGYILQVRWKKIEVTYVKFLGILCTINCPDQFIFDWVIQENIRWRFFRHDVIFCCLLLCFFQLSSLAFLLCPSFDVFSIIEQTPLFYESQQYA